MTHIHDGDSKTTLCGIKMKSKESLPLVNARFVQRHVDGYGMSVCPECAERAG
jgi:hypothetical protein